MRSFCKMSKKDRSKSIKMKYSHNLSSGHSMNLRVRKNGVEILKKTKRGNQKYRVKVQKRNIRIKKKNFQKKKEKSKEQQHRKIETRQNHKRVRRNMIKNLKNSVEQKRRKKSNSEEILKIKHVIEKEVTRQDEKGCIKVLASLRNEEEFNQCFNIRASQFQMKGVQVTMVENQKEENSQQGKEKLYRVDVIEEAQLQFNIEEATMNEEPSEEPQNPEYMTSTPNPFSNDLKTSLDKVVTNLSPIPSPERINLGREENERNSEPLFPRKRPSPVEVGAMRESILAYASNPQNNDNENILIQQLFNESISERNLRKLHRSEIANDLCPLTNYKNDEVIKLDRSEFCWKNRSIKFHCEILDYLNNGLRIPNQLINLWTNPHSGNRKIF